MCLSDLHSSISTHLNPPADESVNWARFNNGVFPLAVFPAGIPALLQAPPLLNSVYLGQFKNLLSCQ